MFSLVINFIHSIDSVSTPVSQFLSPYFSLCIHTFVLCSCVLFFFFCFANRIIYTIFLDVYCYTHSSVFWAEKLLALSKHSSTISFIILHCYNYYICTFGYKGMCTCKFSAVGDINTLLPVSLSISLFYFLKIFITTVFFHSLTVHLIIKNDFRFFSPFYSQRTSHVVIQICY